MIRRLILPVLSGIFLYACTSPNKINTSTVENVDINRYMGNWYEIARYPHSFEKGLVAVTANYRMLEDGTVRVVNLGRKDSLNGEYDAAIGRAKIPDPEEPGKLKVSFFWIFYADYYILELDTVDYNYALIGSSDPDFLWILGRKPQMDDHTYQMLVTNARERGYDISKLNKVPQPEY